MAVKISPVLNEQQFSDAGVLLSGGKIETYLAGSSTPAATYTTSAGTVAQSNPILLNTRGEVDNTIYLTTGILYKLVLKDSIGSVLRTFDNIEGINDNLSSIDQWINSGIDPTFINTTQFTLPGDQTSLFHVNRRVKLLVTAGTVYGYISASVYGALTTVTVVLDSGILDSGLSSVQLGLVTPDNTSLFLIQKDNLASTAVTSKIQPITASVASNALTITLNPTSLDFRNATLTSGTVNTRTVSAAISLVVSSGSTLGTISAQQSRLAVLAIDNAGAVELAVVNLAGGVNLDETGVISTTAEGGAGAADSATVIYSATARTNVPYRVVGFVESTQATAGTWATAPSTIQGYGGQAFAAMSSLGYGQTFSSVTRATGTTYYNTTGKPIFGIISLINISNLNATVSVSINGAAAFTVVSAGGGSSGQVGGSGAYIIPVGARYVFTITNTTSSNFTELR